MRFQVLGFGSSLRVKESYRAVGACGRNCRVVRREGKVINFCLVSGDFKHLLYGVGIEDLNLRPIVAHGKLLAIARNSDRKRGCSLEGEKNSTGRYLPHPGAPSARGH